LHVDFDMVNDMNMNKNEMKTERRLAISQNNILNDIFQSY